MWLFTGFYYFYPMKNNYLLFSILLILFSFSTIEAQEINWMTIEEAEAANKKVPKKIFIDVYTDWCGYCKKMDATTFKDKDMIEYLNKEFYSVKLDGEDKGTLVFKEKEFNFVNKGRRGYNELPASLMQGKLSYPTFVYLNEDLEVLSVIPGYRKANEMLKMVTYLGDDIYKDMKWNEYVEQTKGKE